MTRTVHPRSRGEHVPARLAADRGRRFIPARAGNTGAGGASPSSAPVHPRSRGEHYQFRRHERLSSGSSPLARGTPRGSTSEPADWRFIPARAGNTCRCATAGTCRPVHPRSRGEHPSTPPSGPVTTGSSPLARGTPGARSPHARALPVHPRSRGEHRRKQSGASGTIGSSPLARGTLGGQDRLQAPRRFIPARAGNTISSKPAIPPRPVHPRSRGEHSDTGAPIVTPAGSSPLARGTQEPALRDVAPHRFIPVRAAPVHPRSRGEHSSCRRSPSPPAGSSPLARGTPRPHRPPPRRRRFIPARAGNTHTVSQSAPFFSVHPRSRGEHSRAKRPHCNAPGSSPLARGTRSRRERGHVLRRFIPARAGNTVRHPLRSTSRPVHPRSRGEHGPHSVAPVYYDGSSPLARGTPDERRRSLLVPRFIPARAGNTRRPRRGDRWRPVHPRSRGEHLDARVLDGAAGGSSPLARGTPEPLEDRAEVARFIPARAGNTRRASKGAASVPVHPRSRGEHNVTSSVVPSSSGSSPLARGTRVSAPRCAALSRFIPARAGNTS